MIKSYRKTEPGGWKRFILPAGIFAGVAILAYFLYAFLLYRPAPTGAVPTATHTSAGVEVTRLPSPEGAARAFMDAWAAGDFTAMYALITSNAQSAITRADFEKYYAGVRDQATLQSIAYSVNSVDTTATQAQVEISITLHTVLVGDINRTNQLSLQSERGGWKVDWSGASVLPELAGGNSLVMHHTVPDRGSIFDRNGLSLAAQAAEAVSVGVVPGEVTDEDALVAELHGLLGLPREQLRDMIDQAVPDQYLPLGTVDQSQITSQYPGLSNLNGIRLTGSDSVRYYYGGGVASAVVGYMQQISPDNLAHYKSLGYQGDERVGVTGLEASQEAILAGRQGGTLYVVGPDNNVISILAESDAQPGLNITTTIDRNLQEQMEHTLMGPYRGAAVVLNRNDGEVLAMLSSPSYDSNLFNPDLFNNNYISDLIFARQDQPLFNRAASGGYPLGSVFKIITMAAGLESGLFTPETTYHDTGYFTELPGFVGTDWTVEKDMKPHGTINLIQGLERSCNPFFWHIGYTLFQEDPNSVPDMAAAFGLGKETGIGAIDEYAGVLPSPAAKKASSGGDWTGDDAVLQAIGQGMEVTPLQAADFVAAVGNGGSLFRPQLILSINRPSGEPVFAFSPVLRGLLPVRPETLAAIQEAMRGVVKDPNGTAWSKFWVISDAVKIAGKTGTAQTDQENPDAWFVSYTYNESSTKPDIAAAVVVENVGEGSTYAAPMVRRIMEIYFFGKPSGRYPWESEFGMRATDTPPEGPPPENTPTDTPAP